MAETVRRELVDDYASDIGSYAEIGIGFGDTVLRVCAALAPGSSVYLFDFDDRVENVAGRIEAAHPGTLTIHRFGNTRKLRDSYCWGLLRLVERGERVFDYVYLDGAHDLVIDGFAFHLVDLLLKPRGFIELDDYGWTHGNSPTVNPRTHPPTAQLYTEEQIATSHVKLIVDHLVRPHRHYREVTANRLYQKIA